MDQRCPWRSYAALFATPEKNKLRWWFDVGHEVLLLHPEPPPGAKRHYRTKATERIAEQLCPDEATDREKENMTNRLWQARKLALRFDEWAKLEEFQGDLSIWHVMSLLAVDAAKGSKSTMEETHRRCVAEGWSVEHLKREIQNDKGRKMASGRRPTPLQPATPAMAITDLIIRARSWTTYHDEYLANRRLLLRRARRADYRPSLLRDVREAIQGLEQVQGAVKEELQQLRQLAKDTKAALKGH